MAEQQEKVRLGGMALQNGVLVHGPTSWAVAVRTEDGELRVSSGRKSVRGASVTSPLLRGPIRVLDAFALLPRIRLARPEAKLPFERPAVLLSMVVSAVVAQRLRKSARLGPALRELLGGAFSLLPATLALRGSDLAAYHGAEHITIGTYEHDEPRGKEHERCGSHLIGPLLLTSAVGAALAAKAPERARIPARLGAAVGSVAAATEIFSWMVRNAGHPVAKALAWPGHELQHRFATAEPDSGQLEVAHAALAACLELESRAADDDGAQHPPAG
ncbi:MAG TPA: DUF1385 domain-containing protein [Gaiellaceae bacterium]|jgi:uncharacterized protein YqhQ